jgi:tripartite-type tricarboxylate transporter receptor subunit TctC
MPYNSTKDLAPVTLVAKVPELLVVPAASSAKTLEDFIAAAKAKPGGFNYASTGPGGMPQQLQGGMPYGGGFPGGGVPFLPPGAAGPPTPRVVQRAMGSPRRITR